MGVDHGLVTNMQMFCYTERCQSKQADSLSGSPCAAMSVELSKKIHTNVKPNAMEFLYCHSTGTTKLIQHPTKNSG